MVGKKFKVLKKLTLVSFFGCDKADLYTLSVTITRCFLRVLLIGIAYQFSICE